ncbi:MAG TPA: alpha/beta fold hydrolase, partial [Chthonomonadales bacterium]|nr:alpha/beta fold hydrolase [Chthonomonadales bacterium]
MNLRRIEIPCAEVAVAGLRYEPSHSRKNSVLVYSHGFTSGKHSMDLLASYLAVKGYPGVSFDVQGHKLGGTGGTLDTMEQAVKNLRRAIRWSRENMEPARLVLIGHSMGGALSIAA